MAGPWEKYQQPAAIQAPTGDGLDPVPLPQRPPAQTPAQAEKDTLEVQKLKQDLAAKPETDPALAEAIKGLGIDELLTNIGRARTNINTGFATGLLGSIAGHFPGTPRKDFLGSLEGIKGAAILEKLQALRDQSKNGSSGMGSLTEQEGERLANSIASLSPDMSADQLGKSLDIMERHARSLKAIGAGKNPEDRAVQREFGIGPLPTSDAAPKGDNALAAENPIANGGDGETGPQLGVAQGGARSVIDPKQQALGSKIVDLMSRGASRNTIMGFAVGASPKLRTDPKFHEWINHALAYRAKNPHAKFSVDPSFYTTEVPMGGGEQLRNQAAQSAPVALGTQFVNGATAGNYAKIAGALGGDEGGFNQAIDATQQLHPGASLAGNVLGGTAAALGGEAALGGLGMAPGLLRGALADMTYGGASGVSGDPEKGLAGRVANGALIGLGGSLAGQGLLKVPGALTRGVSSPAASYVAREVPSGMTIGQAVGQSGTAGAALKGIEDRLSGIPIVGDAINARRVEGLQKMNSKAFDRALQPIGGNVSGKFGEEAVQDAQAAVSGAFKKALGGKVATVDQPFLVDATNAHSRIAKLPPSVAPDIQNLVDSAIKDYVDPATLSIKGEDVQPLLRELEGIKSSYYSQGHPAKQRIGAAVDDMIDAVEGIFERQHPGTIAEYDAAKKSFKRLSTLEGAVLAGKNTDGVFTSAQLGTADKANTIKYGGKHAAAAGKGEYHDFQRNTQKVLPSKVPDSGTAGRLVLPALALGAGAGGGAETGYTGTGLTLGGLIALAYTKAGQRALVGSITGRGPAAQKIGRALGKAGRISGAIGGTQAALSSGHD
jgi:hypothetical protein